MEITSPLREITRHPAAMTFPHLPVYPHAAKAGTRFNYPRGIQSSADLGKVAQYMVSVYKKV